VTSKPDKGQEPTAPSARDADRDADDSQTLSPQEFAAEIAQITGIPPADVTEASRLIDDLGLDSLALTELLVVLIDEYDMHSLSRGLEDREWQNVTVRDLYHEYLTGARSAPTSAQPREGPDRDSGARGSAAR
jgi:acyl carrier protein